MEKGVKRTCRVCAVQGAFGNCIWEEWAAVAFGQMGGKEL